MYRFNKLFQRSSKSLGNVDFILTCNDLEIRVAPPFWPHRLVMCWVRHNVTIKSRPISWEPSFKEPQSGIMVWYPPFISRFSINYNELKYEKSKIKRSSADETILIKDIYIVVENINPDRKGKYKKLAKARINLGDYLEAPNGIPLRIKLRPLTAKITSCFVTLEIQRVLNHQTCLPDEDYSNIEGLLLSEDVSSITKKVVYDCVSPNHEINKSLDTKSKNDDVILSGDALVNQQLDGDKILESDVNCVTNEQENEENLCSDDGYKLDCDKNSVIPCETVHDLSSSENDLQTNLFDSKQDNLSLNGGNIVVLSPNEKFDSFVNRTDQSFSISASIDSRTSAAVLETKKDEDDILEWAKKAVFKIPWIKITNLTTSWRNGIGYCALIGARYPSIICVSNLEETDAESNCRLAYEAAELLGLSGDVLGSIDELVSRSSDRDVVSKFLSALRTVLVDTITVEISDEQMRKWINKRNKWKRQSSSLLTTSLSSVLSDETITKSSVSHSVTSLNSVSNQGKSRAKDLIAAAHLNGLDEENFSSEDVYEKQLTEELVALELQEKAITIEKEKFEKRHRQNRDSVSDDTLSQWLKLINDKNSLVRRQTQLITEAKERALTNKLTRLQAALQTFSTLEESQKSVNMRKDEEYLLAELVKTINEKDTLVLELDAQEKAIREDELLKAECVKNPWGRKSTEEDCVVM